MLKYYILIIQINVSRTIFEVSNSMPSNFNSLQIFINIILDMITFKKDFYLIHSFDCGGIIVFG